jgi:ribosomal-protein-alanine N-acetyltransferase
LKHLPILAVYDIALRPLRPSDRHAIVRLCRHPDVSRFLSMPITSTEIFDKYRKWVRAQERRGHCASFVVTRDDEVVGLMQIRVTHPGIGELGWVVHPDMWGSHVFTTAASLLCSFACQEMGLSRLEARIAVENARATRAMSKLGGVKEAVLARSLYIRAQCFDEELWAIVRAAPHVTRPAA